MAAGFWSKVKGVFGKIRQGGKKMFNWLKDGGLQKTVNTVGEIATNVANGLGAARKGVREIQGMASDFMDGKNEFTNFGVRNIPVLSDRADLRNNAVIEKGPVAV